MSTPHWRAHLADGLSVGNGGFGVLGVLLMLAWPDPRALTAACVCVFLAWGCDSLDGLAARGVQRPHAEGAVLDSLCDVVSFGVLPATLLTAFGTRGDRLTLVASAVASLVYFCCAVLRLRRYTVKAVSPTRAERTFFEGLPSPVAAMALSAAIVAATTGTAMPPGMPLAFAAVCGPLMVSHIPYNDLPHLAAWFLRARWPLPVLLALGWAVGGVIAITVFFAAYLASGALGRRYAH
jgi:CDP-diacylglycerol--serine O-phosphatidyltransferase